MPALFLYGPMCHTPLRNVVLGKPSQGQAAVLVDHALRGAEDQPWTQVVPQAGQHVPGLLLRSGTEDALARLTFHAAVLGLAARQMTISTDDGDVVAWVHLIVGGGVGPDWQASAWETRFAAAMVALAREVMARYGQVDPAVLAARRGPLLVRGASRVRAGSPAPVVRRFAAGPPDVAITALRQPYAHFFAVEEYDLSYRRFDGSPSPVVTRAVFVSGDAVTVLPYDPVRDRVLLIEQFRAGPLGRGDPHPWSLEAIAGRIDPGESPQDCARREAHEEAGLTLGALFPVAQYYPSPGAVSEYLYSYVALTDLPDGCEGVFGVEGEAEDIRGHLMSLDDLMALVASGEVENAPLILTALWMQRERGRLRADLPERPEDP